MPIFFTEKSAFVTDLYENVYRTNDLIIRKFATFLSGKVYSTARIILGESELDGTGSYREMLKQMRNYDEKKKEYTVYSLIALDHESIRTLLYELRDSYDDCDCSIEKIVSLCVACGMTYDYITAAVEAFCGEIFTGRSLRKLLLRGIAKGFLSFGEFACQYDETTHSYRFGQYEQNYSLAYAAFKAIPPEEKLGTVAVTRNIDDCESREDFLAALKTSDIQHTFLYDATDISRTVEEIVNARKRPNQSDNSLFDEYEASSLRPGYLRIVNQNYIPRHYMWFIRFCKTFMLSKDEIKKVYHTLHINTDIVPAAESAFAELLNS